MTWMVPKPHLNPIGTTDTAVPRTWQEAADTEEEHAAMLIDMDRSQDQINDRKEDSNDR